MKILITGGAGFIAFHLARRLREEGHEIALLDNLNDFYNPELKRQNVRDIQREGPASIYQVDILDTANLRRSFEDFRPHAVVHLAAWAGVRPSIEKPSLYAQVNVTGTVHVLDLARQYAVESFMFGSSSSVYGANTKLPFSEEDPIHQPVSPYAATKRAGELLCYTYSHIYSMNITCLRFFTVYGPRQRPEMAVHKFAKLIWEEKEVPIFGNGQTRRDYTYVDDIVSGILAALDLNPRYEIFNLGESRTVSLLELISLLEKALGKKSRLTFLPPQPGDMSVTQADISRSQRVLGYQPKTSIEDGIRKFVAWFLTTVTGDK